MTDPISDMLNRIRNAYALSKQAVSIPFSSLKYQIAKIMAEEGFILKVERKGRQTGKIIEIELKESAISGLKRVSRPSQRIYVGAGDIKKVKGGYGMAIISTSKGVMSNKEARKRKLGGEIICEIW